MNSEPSPESEFASEPENAVTHAGRIHLPNIGGWLLIGFIVLILAGIFMPVFNTVNRRSAEIKTLSNAKAVGLALKLFAGDNNGCYPRRGVPVEMSGTPTNSNTAFACLFPTYTTSETLFAVKTSAYQSRVPDNVIDTAYAGKPVKTLEPGENALGYIMGLTENDNPSLPLVVDGTDGTGHYVADPKKLGGVWQGKYAVVIHLDNSGSLENLVGPDNARFVPRTRDDRTHNLLAAAYLAANHARLLDPAVAANR